MPVFAIFSVFLETKFFAIFRTNIADELILLTLLAGLGLIIFSKEKNETEELDLLRLKALAKAGISNLIFLFVSVLFIYVSVFIAILVINIFTFIRIEREQLKFIRRGLKIECI
jgi:uncharacterized Tic20 family protein